MAFVKFEDKTLGLVWGNSSTPVSLTSSSGLVEILKVDYMDSAIVASPIPNPWYVRWMVTTGYNTSQMEVFTQPYTMEFSWSNDDATWTVFKSFKAMAYLGMPSRQQYRIDNQPSFPRYIRFRVGIETQPGGTLTYGGFLAGIDNFTI